MVKFIVLMECTHNGKITMKWAKCENQEDVDDVIRIYENLYQDDNPIFEVYEVNQ